MADSPYFIESGFTIPAGVTLALKPGVVVKDHYWYSGSINVQGTIIAQGTTESPIVFTDDKDDLYGGDSNGDGSATAPEPGGWSSLTVSASSGASSVFSHCLFRYGGSASGAVNCPGSSPTITNCRFYKCKISLDVKTGAAPVVENNVFEENTASPISITYDIVPAYANNTFLNNQINGLGLRGQLAYDEPIAGNYTLTQANVAGIENIPYVISTSITISEGAILTIAAGVILKHNDYSSSYMLSVKGPLLGKERPMNRWFLPVSKTMNTAAIPIPMAVPPFQWPEQNGEESICTMPRVRPISRIAPFATVAVMPP